MAILLNNKLKYEEIRNLDIPIESKAITFEILLNNKYHRVLNTYAPNIPDLREKFFRDLNNKYSTSIPTIWGGDFNCVENILLDKMKTPANNECTRGTQEIFSFKKLHKIEDHYRLSQGQIKGPDFTCFKNQNGARIDRLYLPEDSLEHAKSDIIHFHKDYKLDHNLTWTSFIPNKGKPKKRGQGFWKFNTSLLNNATYDKQIRKDMNNHIRNSSQYDCYLEWWEIMKAHIIRANTITFSKKLAQEKRKIFNDAKKKLSIELRKSIPDPTEVLLLKSILENEEKDRQELLRIQSRQDSLQYGERSSAYFMTSLREREKHVTIEALKDTNGQTHTNPQKKLEIIHDFYKNLFDSDNAEIDLDKQKELLEKIDKTLSDTSREKLEKDLTLKELKTATKLMNKNKTPGIDGIPAEFFQKYQKILLPCLLRVALLTKENNKMSETQRQAIIALLHKGGDTDLLSQYRPISLLCVDYKIITKAFAIRIQHVLHEIIGENQTAGIPGRSIFNNLWQARDMFDYAKETNQTNYLFNLDQSKAFDMVNHSFMVKTMEKFGFGPEFMKQIKTFYKACTSTIQNEGFFSQKVPIRRGVRQGCPLSCYLYIIVAETLAISIRKDKQIKGFRMPPPATHEQSVKIMLYADDTIIPLSKGPNEASNRNNFKRVLLRLKEYALASGSKLNMGKSKILVFGGDELENRIETEKLKTILESTDLEMEILPIDEGVKILGISFYGSPETTYERNYETIEKKMTKKINHLKMRCLSVKGRALALNTLVLSKLWYVSAVIPLTDINLNNLYARNRSTRIVHDKPHFLPRFEKICHEYLSGNTIMKDYEQPITSGGLNVACIGYKAIAMRAKQLNQIFNENSKTPSTRTAWYWLSCSYTITNLHAHTRFISRYNHDAPRTGLKNRGIKTTTEPKHKGYLSLANLCTQEPIKKLFQNPDKNQLPKKFAKFYNQLKDQGPTRT